MRIGVPAEIKNNEHRVGLTPESVYELCSAGLAVNIQSQAGSAIGFTDQDYQQSGATILSSASDVYESSDLIVKVKEPLPEEFKFLSPDKTLFTYLHLAGNKSQAVELMNTGVTGIAYETVTSSDGSLPLLAPMSKIAGQISVVVGQYFLLKPNGGIGTILGSVENIERRVVTVIGAGVAGTEAIKKAIANDAHLKILDLSQKRLDELKEQFGTNNIEYILSDSSSISSALEASDLVIGSVYVLGKEAPKVITEEMIKKMKPGSVLVDISIDQGGCIESSKPTTHDAPVFNKHGVVHYCVTNMPGAVPLTATLALNNATLPYVKALATQGVDEALKNDSHLFNGLNIKNGEVVNPPEVKMAGPNGEVIDLMVFPNRRTPFVKYQGGPNLQFFKEIKVEGQADVQRQVIGQVQLPVATQSALLLFYPRDQAMSSFNVYPLLNVSQSVPAGKALVFNTCPFNIAAQLGSSPVFQMKPQEQRLADIRPKDFFLQYQFWMPNKNEWRKAYSSKKAVDPESSLILILHPRMNGDGSMNPRLIDMLSLSAK